MAVFQSPGLDAQKKTAHAAEQERADVLTRRQAWFDGQTDLDPERLVFIDETWASTNMARTHGRCPRGERLRMAVPHGHWKTTTLVAGLGARGVVAPWVLDGAINGDAFETYVGKVLVPELKVSIRRRPSCVIPTCADHHPWAHSRIPMDMIFDGRSTRLFQVSQQRATMSS